MSAFLIEIFFLSREVSSLSTFKIILPLLLLTFMDVMNLLIPSAMDA